MDARLPPDVLCFFFFQAEDGIRDLTVTGVQTCALPIFGQGHVTARETIVSLPPSSRVGEVRVSPAGDRLAWHLIFTEQPPASAWLRWLHRSEERRVGEECRSRWWADH